MEKFGSFGKWLTFHYKSVEAGPKSAFRVWETLLAKNVSAMEGVEIRGGADFSKKHTHSLKIL
jgi:hypothetical protein